MQVHVTEPWTLGAAGKGHWDFDLGLKIYHFCVSSLKPPAPKAINEPGSTPNTNKE